MGRALLRCDSTKETTCTGEWKGREGQEAERGGGGGGGGVGRRGGRQDLGGMEELFVITGDV
eukprot:760208-Hanusia_phi.AAC.5